MTLHNKKHNFNSTEVIVVINHSVCRLVGRSAGRSRSHGFHTMYLISSKDGGISIMQYIMQLHAVDVTCDDKNTVTWHDMTCRREYSTTSNIT